MVVENTEKNREIKDVVATMAIENMYLSKDFIKELIKVSNGEKTSEQLRQEVINKYARTRSDYNDSPDKKEMV